MKKSLVALLLLSSLLTSNVYAETVKTENNKPSVTAQEQQQNKNRPMLNASGVFCLSVKDLAEMMDLDLAFDNQSKVITLKNEKSTLRLGLKDNICKFNGEVINPINVFNYEGTNFLPAFEVARLFDCVCVLSHGSVFITPITQAILDVAPTYLDTKFRDFGRDIRIHAETTNYQTMGVDEEYFRACMAILTNYTIDQTILSNKMSCFTSDEELAVFGLTKNKIMAQTELNEFMQCFLSYQIDNYFIPQLSGTKYEEELKALSKKQKEDSTKLSLGLITLSEHNQIIRDLQSKISQEIKSIPPEDYRLYEDTFITYRASVFSRLSGVLANFHLS